MKTKKTLMDKIKIAILNINEVRLQHGDLLIGNDQLIDLLAQVNWQGIGFIECAMLRP